MAGAQSSDSFSVSDVGVDAVAETATEAREIAVASGQREALDRLIRRLTLRENRLQIPELADAAIAPLVRGIEIEEEKTSSKRYLASLTVSFKKNEVRTLLRGNGIPFSETPSKPLLVLPVYEAAGARNLWDDSNPWWVAWQARSERDSLVPLVIPVGDLTDIATIGAQQALSGDDQPLAVIARRYGAADVLVAHAILRHDLAAGIPRLSVTLHRHGSESNSIVVESFSGVSRTMVDGLLERAAEEVASQIEENWKRLTLLRFEDEGMLSARVPLSGLVDWVEVRSRLSRAPEVSRVEILQVNREAAQVALHYFGSPQQLAVTLAQRDLDLVGEEGSWSVRLREKRGASAGGNRAADE
ncbi:MAG: DUF2066 domain-containing protein [Alphaproteobacteria bacterium]|nr:DUF2066 domain-containing protein [Alphaproteobacteria bacterium]